MDSLEFISVAPPAAASPARADIACFAGFVARQPHRSRLPSESDQSYLSLLPPTILQWLLDTDWIYRDAQNLWQVSSSQHDRDADALVALTDLPVPIENWETFDRLFAWQDRPIARSELKADTLLGAAVRSFFAQGGRKCYVLPLGDPWEAAPQSISNAAALDKILPLYPKPNANDRQSWKGIGHLFGLLDVSYLCLPDLPDLFATPRNERPSLPVPAQREDFVECASRLEPPSLQSLQGLSAPTSDAAGFQQWSSHIGQLIAFLENNGLREIQLVAALPLPIQASGEKASLTENRAVQAARQAQWEAASLTESPSLQLVYPWVRSRESRFVPGNLIPPDGPFIGLLAANTISNGSWQSLNQLDFPRIDAVFPILDQSQLKTPLGANVSLTRRDRLTLLGPTSGGLRVLSDVTTEPTSPLRFASVNRLLIAILRAARIVGETNVFENNGEILWRRITESLENLLGGFWSEGALYGTTAAEAYEVRCDRSTMTQSDIDAGRAIARVVFTASLPITRIVVVFALQNSGEVQLVSTTTPALAPTA